MAHTLYLVATPIGNLQDFSERAAACLREVDLIACEDTRVSAKLLSAYGIQTPTQAYHAHSRPELTEALVARLQAGEDIALISDAGTPLISDPGSLLVQQAIEAGVQLVAIPGASALLSALLTSGLPTHPFGFLGFLPRSDAPQKRILGPLAPLEMTWILYESPRRLQATLKQLELCWGDRPAAVARELTKRFEETRRGRLSELAANYESPPKGEVVIVVGPPEAAQLEAKADELDSQARALLKAGRRPSDAAKTLSRALGVSRKQAYQALLDAETDEAKPEETPPEEGDAP